MTQAALQYHDNILNSFLIGLNDESPEYLEMIDAYMKGVFFDFFIPKNLYIGLKRKIPRSLIMKKMPCILKDKENMTSLPLIIIKYLKAVLFKP